MYKVFYLTKEIIFVQDIKKLNARLIRIESEDLFFTEKNAEYKINFNNIIKAKVLISF